MAEKREIEVVIAPDGSVRIETHDIAGPGCEAATRALEQALGRVRNRTRKREFYAQGATRTTGAVTKK